jgi:hypothetical protein
VKLVDVRSLLFVVVSLTLISQPLFGRQTTRSPKPVVQTPANSNKQTPKSRSGHFIVVDDGVEVLRLFQMRTPRGGEVAILRLSQEKYKEFVHDPTKFVNKTYQNRIFLFKVNGVTAAGKAPTAKAGDDMVVMIGHDGGCYGKYIAEMLPD